MINFIEENFQKKKISIVAGCPAIGKTSLGVSMAIALAWMERNVLILSLERTEEAYIQRMLQQLAFPFL